MIDQMTLPYPQDAIAPVISGEAMHFHYDKHFAAYVTKTNAAIEGTAHATAPLEQIVRDADAKGDNGLFNNSGQVWNHAFFWNSLSPTEVHPTGDLAAAIDRDCGGREALLEAMVKEGTGHFASGWVWLVTDASGKLSVTSSHDGRPIWTDQDCVPLLVCDLWEHAYYVDWRNDRAAFLKNVSEKNLNWQFASDNYDRRSIWAYGAAN